MLILTVPARLKRAGMETKLLIDGTGEPRAPDRSLLRLLAQAHRYRAMVLARGDKTITALAAEAGASRSYFTRILRLGFLAPDLVKMILRGRLAGRAHRKAAVPASPAADRLGGSDCGPRHH